MHSEDDPPPSLAPVVWAPAQPLKASTATTALTIIVLIMDHLTIEK